MVFDFAAGIDGEYLNIKFLLSDLDGVIRHFPAERNTAIEREFGLPSGSILLAAFEKNLLTQAVCGQIVDEHWRQQIALSLSKHCELEAAKDAVCKWSNFAGEVDREYLSYIKSRFHDAAVVLLTNGTTRLKGDLVNLGIDDLFSKIFNSAEIGVCKPDPKIFRHVIQSLNCKPDEILFIDDSLSHIQAAMELGLETHHYKSLAALKNMYG